MNARVSGRVVLAPKEAEEHRLASLGCPSLPPPPYLFSVCFFLASCLHVAQAVPWASCAHSITAPPCLSRPQKTLQRLRHLMPIPLLHFRVSLTKDTAFFGLDSKSSTTSICVMLPPRLTSNDIKSFPSTRLFFYLDASFAVSINICLLRNYILFSKSSGLVFASHATPWVPGCSTLLHHSSSKASSPSSIRRKHARILVQQPMVGQFFLRCLGLTQPLFLLCRRGMFSVFSTRVLISDSCCVSCNLQLFLEKIESTSVCRHLFPLRAPRRSI